MNKFLTTVISLATLGCVAFGATACGMSDDPEEVGENLKKNGYSVYVEDDADDIGDYFIIFDLDADLDDIDLAIRGVHPVNKDKMIFMVFCEDEDTAEDLYEQAESLFDEWCILLDWDEEEYSIGVSGKVAYVGHEDAIEAAKG